MRLYLLVVVTLMSLALAVRGREKQMLQLEIDKTNVGSCKIKSRKGDTLKIHYTAKLEDGTEFDSSISRDKPFKFKLGAGKVITGWDEGLNGMCKGEKRALVIPPDLAYGDKGLPPKVPGGATVIFEVELLSIKQPKQVKLEPESKQSKQSRTEL